MSLLFPKIVNFSDNNLPLIVLVGFFVVVDTLVMKFVFVNFAFVLKNYDVIIRTCRES